MRSFQTHFSEVSVKTKFLTEFDEAAWRQTCKQIAKQAADGCGQSHGYYVDRYSSGVDYQVKRMPEDHQAQALKIAVEWDYATPAERQADQEWNAENGYCSHGIKLGYCPAGCGSGPND